LPTPEQPAAWRHDPRVLIKANVDPLLCSLIRAELALRPGLRRRLRLRFRLWRLERG